MARRAKDAAELISARSFAITSEQVRRQGNSEAVGGGRCLVDLRKSRGSSRALQLRFTCLRELAASCGLMQAALGTGGALVAGRAPRLQDPEPQERMHCRYRQLRIRLGIMLMRARSRNVCVKHNKNDAGEMRSVRLSW